MLLGMARLDAVHPVEEEVVMLYPLLPQTKMSGPRGFHCSRLSTYIAMADCMDRYVHYTALNRRDSPCFQCAQGAKNREEFSRS